MADRNYLVDANVFITAKNKYYAFDICPGFWECLLHHHRENRTFSVDRVRDELLVGRDTEDLVLWVKHKVPAGFFLTTATDEVLRAYTEVLQWVRCQPNYSDRAKAKFAAGADGWLVACAQVHPAMVVTDEEPDPSSKRHAKLPDICQAFGVPWDNTFGMLRTLQARFNWAGPTT